MGPDDVAAGGGVGGVEDVGAADFFVTFGAELCDDEVAFFVEEEEAVAVFYDEGIGPTHFFFVVGGDFHGFPDALTGVGFQAAELAVAAGAVDVAVFKKWSAHGAMQGVGIFFTYLFALPEERGVGFIRRETKHHGAVVEAGEEKQVIHFARSRDGHAGLDVARM